MASNTLPQSRGVRSSGTSIGRSQDRTTPASDPSVTAMSEVSGRGGSKVYESASSLRSRRPKAVSDQTKRDAQHHIPESTSSLADGVGRDETTTDMPTMEPDTAKVHPKWVAFALFSGAFAALNGVFAKLTTSDNTVALATYVHHFLPFLDTNILTIILRASFFGLNIASNAVMWILFTRALTSHPSTTKVSVVNTSANFTITAIMGSLVFGEAVGGVGGIFGLALLVGGCVVLGAEEKKKEEGTLTIDGVDAEAADVLVDAHEVEFENLIDLQDEAKSVAARTRPGVGILEGTESEDEVES